MRSTETSLGFKFWKQNVVGDMQDERYSMYIGRMAIVPMTYGRHVPIISDRVKPSIYFFNDFCFNIIFQFQFGTNLFWTPRIALQWCQK